MRSSGIVHAGLAGAIAGLRHTELFAVSDSGLPVPAHVPLIDLGVGYGLPGFLPVLRLVLAETTVEAAWASADVATRNEVMHEALTAELPAALSLDLLDHEDLKRRVADCRFVVRTGEATPFANVLLRSGVPWM